MALEPSNGESVVIIDDHDGVRLSLRALLEANGFEVTDHASAETYLAGGPPYGGRCLIVDVELPGMNGLELQTELARRKAHLPLIVITGNASIRRAVDAIKAGALDFLEKPFDDEVLLQTIQRAIQERPGTDPGDEEAAKAASSIALLTDREREVLARLVQGDSNKQAARALGISPRTVEVHRSNLQNKLDARSLSDLVRLARLAGQLT